MLLALVLSIVSHFHPVHISVTEINYSDKDKALQIMSKIFIDDLELAIQREVNDRSLNILKPLNGKTTDQLVSDYLLQHLKVKVDGKLQTMHYLGSEVEGVSITCYVEILNVKKLKTVEPLNDVIMEIHKDQSNLVHVTYKDQLKSVRLIVDKPEEILTFETK